MLDILNGEFIKAVLLEQDGKKYAFDYVNITIREITDDCFNILNNINNKQSISEAYAQYNKNEVDDALEYFKSLSINEIVAINTNINDKLRGHRGANITLAPTLHKCNLKCDYCYSRSAINSVNSHAEFSIKTIHKTLEYIYYELYKDSPFYRFGFVAGGEPLLRFDLMKIVKEVGDVLYKRTGKLMFMALCTNGTLLTEEVLSFLVNSNVALSISIDGDKDIHDNMRKLENGEGSYSLIMNSLNNMRMSEKYQVLSKRMTGLFLVTGNTKSLVNTLINFKNIGFGVVRGKIIRLSKDSKYSINESNINHIKTLYAELIDFFKEQVKLNKIDILLMILNNTDFIGRIIVKLILGKRDPFECNAAVSKITITSDGDIFPCSAFVGHCEFKIGNISHGIDAIKRNKFIEKAVFERDKCKKCWMMFLCGGDCFVNSYVVNNDIYEPDEIKCEILCHAALLAIDLVCYIKTNNIVIYNALYNYLFTNYSHQQMIMNKLIDSLNIKYASAEAAVPH